jgi:uncharacterized protein (TIGR01777 family)
MHPKAWRRAAGKVQAGRPDLMIRKLVLTGGTGLIGRALTHSLLRGGVSEGLEVLLLVRRPVRPQTDRRVTELEWHPERTPSLLDTAPLEEADAAVHLSGANVAAHRWTPAYKRLIRSSRIASAQALGRLCAGLSAPPPVVVAASATGYYGDRGGEILTEAAGPGRGFLAEVCQGWEASTALLAPRVAQLRFSVVLTSRGGAFPQLARLFRLGLGGRIGSGRQWMSWVTLGDAVGAIRYALDTPALSGPLNVTSPFPVTNAEFTRTLGHLLRRPTLLTVPGLVARAAFGEMARETLLASTRAMPERLHAAGFQFSDERLEQALAEML